jgi:hypothetical protein
VELLDRGGRLRPGAGDRARRTMFLPGMDSP